MKDFKKMLPSYIFNILVTVIIVTSGILMNVSFSVISLLLLVYMFIRLTIKNGKHYKLWQECAFWSPTLLSSLFLVSKFDLRVGILMACIAALYTSNHVNKTELEDDTAEDASDTEKPYQWKKQGEFSKYQDIHDYVKYNPICPKLLEFEKYLKETNSLHYLCFKCIFRDGMKWEPARRYLEFEDTKRLNDILREIAPLFRYATK